MRTQLSPQALPVFGSAPAPGANTGALFRVGSSLYYDNGTALVPLDLQGDWVGRTVTDADGTLAVNDNVVFMSSAAAHSFAWVASSTTALPLNKLIEIIAIGAGVVTVTAPSGVTFVGPGVNGAAGSYSVQVPGQGKALSFIQRAVDTWQVLGGGAPGATYAYADVVANEGVNQNLANGVTTKLVLPVVNALSGFTFDSATNEVICGVAGRFMVYGALLSNTGGEMGVLVLIYINGAQGSTERTGFHKYVGTFPQTMPITTQLSLAVGDRVSLWAQVNGRDESTFDHYLRIWKVG